MTERPLAIFILAAGKGTRTRLDVPKVLLPICGAPLLEFVLDTALTVEPSYLVVVLHHGIDKVRAALGDRFEREGCLVVDQGKPLGTGHAVRRALEELDGHLGQSFEGDVLVLYGDMPLITTQSLDELLQALESQTFEPHSPSNGRHARPGGGVPASLLTTSEVAPMGYGRILRDAQGRFLGIREEKDCSPDELKIEETNTGVCAFDAAALRDALPRLSTKNRQGEYYLTDVFGLLVESGASVPTVSTDDPDEILGVNSLRQLADARWAMQDRLFEWHLERGVLIEDPGTTVIERDVEIGPGTRILPFTVLRRGVRIGATCEVGPFSHLREGSVLENGAEVGNFVEMKKSVLGPGSKAKHLTYLGDAVVGTRANIGAGTITANYDGKAKHRTFIGDRAFVGSGTILVAPSSIGDGATTGAGAVVTRRTEVPKGETWVGVPARPLRRDAVERPAPEDPASRPPDEPGKEGGA